MSRQSAPIMLERGASSQPLHIQIAAIFRDRILSGLWQKGESIPPEKLLCAEFEVARGTIRQALQTLEDEGLLRREQGRGTFVELGRQNTVSGRPGTGHLAFIVPYVRDSSVPTILIGFQQVAEQASYSVIFNHVNNDTSQQEQVIRKLIRDGIDGIALYPVDSEHITPLDSVAQSGLPLVLIDRYIKGLTTDYVMSNHFGGALTGVNYLMEIGHRRIGFVTWISPAVSMEHRLLGYMQALRERGIEPRGEDVCYINGYPTFDLTPLIGYLSRPDRPSAIFAANDQIASAVYRAASQIGLSIPADLSVVGFDNLDLSPHLDPPLTTIAQPFTQIGHDTAELLIKRLQGDRQPHQQIALSTKLIERGSTRRV